MITYAVVIVDNLGRDYNGGKDEIGIARNLADTEAKRIAKNWNKLNNPTGESNGWAIVRQEPFELYQFTGY